MEVGEEPTSELERIAEQCECGEHCRFERAFVGLLVVSFFLQHHSVQVRGREGLLVACGCSRDEENKKGIFQKIES